MHRATKERELPESADRSIARRAERTVALGHGSRHGRLDKMCLLIEVSLKVNVSGGVGQINLEVV